MVSDRFVDYIYHRFSIYPHIISRFPCVVGLGRTEIGEKDLDRSRLNEDACFNIVLSVKQLFDLLRQIILNINEITVGSFQSKFEHTWLQFTWDQYDKLEYRAR